AARGDRDVVRRCAVEDEVSRARRTADPLPEMRLRRAVARHGLAERAEDVPDEPRAVKPPRRRPAPEVAEAEEALRLSDDARAGESRRLGELRPRYPALAVRRPDTPGAGRRRPDHREARAVAED